MNALFNLILLLQLSKLTLFYGSVQCLDQLTNHADAATLGSNGKGRIFLHFLAENWRLMTQRGEHEKQM